MMLRLMSESNLTSYDDGFAIENIVSDWVFCGLLENRR